MPELNEEHLPEWERGLLDEQMARQRRIAALRAGRAVLNAYQLGMSPISARYLADTLLLVLHATDEGPDGT